MSVTFLETIKTIETQISKNTHYKLFDNFDWLNKFFSYC